MRGHCRVLSLTICRTSSKNSFFMNIGFIYICVAVRHHAPFICKHIAVLSSNIFPVEAMLGGRFTEFSLY